MQHVRREFHLREMFSIDRMPAESFCRVEVANAGLDKAYLRRLLLLIAVESVLATPQAKVATRDRENGFAGLRQEPDPRRLFQ